MSPFQGPKQKIQFSDKKLGTIKCTSSLTLWIILITSDIELTVVVHGSSRTLCEGVLDFIKKTKQLCFGY